VEVVDDAGVVVLEVVVVGTVVLEALVVVVVAGLPVVHSTPGLWAGAHNRTWSSSPSMEWLKLASPRRGPPATEASLDPSGDQATALTTDSVWPWRTS
jgi:hypothetical protein